MEEAFSTLMGTIRKRADHVWQVIGPAVSQNRDTSVDFLERLLLRDETDVICEYMTQGDLLRRLVDPEEPLNEQEVRQQMSKRLAELLSMRASDPEKYRQFLRVAIRSRSGRIKGPRQR